MAQVKALRFCVEKEIKVILNVCMVWVWNFPHYYSDSDTFILE